MILASALLSQYTRVTDIQTTTDDVRQHLMRIAELAMQLQVPLKSVELMWKISYFRMRDRYAAWVVLLQTAKYKKNPEVNIRFSHMGTHADVKISRDF